MNFNVSVVIPVFNASSYVEESCLSALQQNEAAEVILVEDGSLDDSLLVCQKLVRLGPRVKLYQHEGNVNKGPSESRNLGV